MDAEWPLLKGENPPVRTNRNAAVAQLSETSTLGADSIDASGVAAFRADRTAEFAVGWRFEDDRDLLSAVTSGARNQAAVCTIDP